MQRDHGFGEKMSPVSCNWTLKFALSFDDLLANTYFIKEEDLIIFTVDARVAK